MHSNVNHFLLKSKMSKPKFVFVLWYLCPVQYLNIFSVFCNALVSVPKYFTIIFYTSVYLLIIVINYTSQNVCNRLIHNQTPAGSTSGQNMSNNRCRT